MVCHVYLFAVNELFLSEIGLRVYIVNNWNHDNAHTNTLKQKSALYGHNCDEVRAQLWPDEHKMRLLSMLWGSEWRLIVTKVPLI